MSTHPAGLKYRIKGLPHSFDSSGAEDQFTSSSHSNPIDPSKAMGQILGCLRQPHITDTLYHFHEVSKLSRHWPTFSFLRPSRVKGWIKSTPVHLVRYLGWPPPQPSEKDAFAIWQAYQKQDAEQEAIGLLLHRLEEGIDPQLTHLPMAMSIASHLFCGSGWFWKNRDQIRKIILRSPTASFVALSSGAFAGDNTPFINRAASNPRLVLEVGRMPILKRQVTNAWFRESLKNHPIYFSLWLFMCGELNPAWALLRQTAKADPLAAGICLGVDPFCSDAKNWTSLTANHPEALYWAGRIWVQTHHDISTHPLSKRTAAFFSGTSPQWYYHWLRDIDFDHLDTKVSELWPNPWMIELIVDLRLSKDFVSELAAKKQLDAQDPIERTVLHWASDYVTNEYN